jgi:TolB-like protein/DNA-binding winged helix-turn-helix (wHTH) protein/Tfp pilus assembly protein PilF
MHNELRHFYDFAGFRLEARERLLLRQGQPVELSSKAFETLLVLVRSSGRLVPKEELMRSVWPDTIVEEGNLTLAIHNLRKALANGSNGTKYIETVPRHGYRFVAEVEERWEPMDRRDLVPQPVELRSGLEQAERGRARKPRKRWRRLAIATAALLAFAAVFLYRIRIGSVPQAQSIGVLPFLNLSPDSSSQYLSDGITEELTTRLAQISGLRVAARTSAFQFQSRPRDIREIARRLNVGVVLEGSLARSPERMHVTAQLISSRTGYHLWSASYDRQPEQMFEVQEEIVDQVAKALNVPLSSAQQARLAKPDTVDPQAHDLYLQGRYLWNQRSRGNKLEQSITLFARATERDPGYALAYTGLADAYAVAAVNNNAAAFAPGAKIAARTALALDNTLAEPHATLGLVESQLEWKFAEAESEFERALELDPANAAAHHWRGLNLTILGRFADADAEFRKAQLLDPTALMISDGLAENFYYARRFEDAISQTQRMLEVDPGMPAAKIVLCQSYLAAKMYAGCLKTAEGFGSEPGMRELKRLFTAQAEAGTGRLQAARKMASELENSSLARSNLAGLYATLKDSNRAFHFLDEAYANHDPHLAYLKLDPFYDSLRTDSRYLALVHKVGLSQ